jgi:lipooligosaccharide transport system permease protein
MSSEPNVNTVESAPRATRSVRKPEHEPFVAAMPANASNWMSVWRRNYLVWKKLAIASMFGNLADPMIYRS